MFRLSRYLATVRRATPMPSPFSVSTIMSSEMIRSGVSSSMSARIRALTPAAEAPLFCAALPSTPAAPLSAAENKSFNAKIPAGVSISLLATVRLIVLSCKSKISAISRKTIGSSARWPSRKNAFCRSTTACATRNMVIARCWVARANQRADWTLDARNRRSASLMGRFAISSQSRSSTRMRGKASSFKLTCQLSPSRRTKISGACVPTDARVNSAAGRGFRLCRSRKARLSSALLRSHTSLSWSSLPRASKSRWSSSTCWAGSWSGRRCHCRPKQSRKLRANIPAGLSPRKSRNASSSRAGAMSKLSQISVSSSRK